MIIAIALTMSVNDSCAATAEIYVLINHDINYQKEFYDSFIDAMDAHNGEAKVKEITISELESNMARMDKDRSILVVVGSKLSTRISELGLNLRTIYAMLARRALSESLIQEQGEVKTIIYIEQPWGRYAALIKALLPDRKSVFTLESVPRSQHDAEFKEFNRLGMDLSRLEVSDRTGLVEAISGRSGRKEVMLALPDTELVNSDTAKSIIITALKNDIPIVGYSQGFVKAGALASVYSKPEDYAKQTAETVAGYLSGKSVSENSYPKYYSISINYQIARIMGLEVPSEKETLARMAQILGEE